MFGDNGSATLCLRVARLMSLTIFSPGLFGVFLIVHSSMITMSQKHSRRKKLFVPIGDHVRQVTIPIFSSHSDGANLAHQHLNLP